MAELQIGIQLRVEIPENGLSINNLLYQIKQIIPKIFFGILEAILSAVEQRRIERLQESAPGRYVRNGLRPQPRQLQTAFGKFGYRMARVLDKDTGHTFCPLLGEIGLAAYQRTSEASAEGGIGLVCHVSYRKSVKEVDRILGTGMSRSTLHRQTQRFGQQQCGWPDMKRLGYRFLMVDGTKVRLQQKGKDGIKSRKVEMRWALASVDEHQQFDLVGIWIDGSWKQVRQDLERRLDYGKLEVLFSDGGPGIEENLIRSGMRCQRCVWHAKRDFPYVLYADQVKKPQQGPLKQAMDSIELMKLTKAKLEKISPAEAQRVLDLADKTKQGFVQLLEVLPEDTYPHARTYIQNLASQVTTFFDFWLQHKVWIPITTNAIENAFSQVKNRIWAVGKRWSEHGLMNWLKVVVYKVFYPQSWDRVWEQYLGLDPRLRITITGVSYQWI